MGRISCRDFKDVFGKSLTKVSEEMHVTKEYTSQAFRGLLTRNFFTECLAEKLTVMAEENLKNDIEIAQYRRRKAERYIVFLKTLPERKRSGKGA